MEAIDYSRLIKNMPIAYALHEMIYDNSGIAIDYRFLDINEEFQRLTNLSSEQIIGKTCLEIMPQTELFWIEKYAECIKNNSEVHFEGQSSVLGKFYEITAYSPAQNHFIAMFFDISCRKKAMFESNKIASFFQSITENSTDGVVVLDTEMKFTYISEGASRMFGYKIEDLKILRPDLLTHPDDVKRVISNIETLLKNPLYKPTIEYRFKKKNGEWLWIESTITNLYSQPEVNGLVINFRDITERKIYTEKLLQSEQRYRLTQEAGNIGSWEYYIDKNKYWNSTQLRQIFGIENFESEDINDEVESCIVNNDFVKQTLFNLIHRKTPYEIEFEIYRKNDGAKRIIKSQAHLACESESDKPLLVRGVLTDITTQKQAEQKLKQSEAILEATLIHSRFGIWSVDTNNLLLYTNQTFKNDIQKTFGVEIQVGKSIIDILPQDLKSVWIERYQKAFANNSFIEEDIIETEFGKIYIEVSTTPILIDGKVVGASFFGQDITTRRNAEIELKKSEEKYQELYNLFRLLADTLPDMLWAKNLKKEYIFANKAMCDNLLCAVNTDEPIGKTDMFFAKRERSKHPENVEWHTFGEICADTDDIVLEHKKHMQFDEYGNVKGKYLFLNVHKAPVYDAQNNLIGIVGTGRDETEKKKIENTLYKNTLNLEKALKVSVEFIKPTENAISYDSISKLLREITESDCVIICHLNATHTQIVSINGHEEKIKQLEKEYDYNIIEKKWNRNPDFESILEKQHLTYLNDFSSIVTETDLLMVNALQQKFNIGDVVLMPIEGNDRFVAVVIFVYESKKTLINAELIKMIGIQLGQYLERKNIEDALSVKMLETERFLKLTVNRELNMIELKKEVNTLLGELGRDEKYKIVR